MKIALINGSPKGKASNSNLIMQDLKPLLNEKDKIIEYHFNKHLNLDTMKSIKTCNRIVFFFPLYVDGIPAHLLHCLMQLEMFFPFPSGKDMLVYSCVNCGFYEGHQNTLALGIMKNWCQKAGLSWGQGIGIGAGAMLNSLKKVPLGKGPKQNLEKALQSLATNISSGSQGEDLFITANFPRLAYKISAEQNWRQKIKSNGLKRKDLFTRK